MISIRPVDERRATKASMLDAELAAIRRDEAAPAPKGTHGRT
jgi:hypothetical protein